LLIYKTETIQTMSQNNDMIENKQGNENRILVSLNTVSTSLDKLKRPVSDISHPI